MGLRAEADENVGTYFTYGFEPSREAVDSVADAWGKQVTVLVRHWSRVGFLQAREITSNSGVRDLGCFHGTTLTLKY